MQRLIRSFNTLTDQLKDTLQEQYPDGIDASHIKSIPTAKGEILRVIELRTAEALYLIKINSESRAEIEEFLDQDESAAEEGDTDSAIDDNSTEIESDDVEEEDEEEDDTAEADADAGDEDEDEDEL